jgi:hypothetical protein
MMNPLIHPRENPKMGTIKSTVKVEKPVGIWPFKIRNVTRLRRVPNRTPQSIDLVFFIRRKGDIRRTIEYPIMRKRIEINGMIIHVAEVHLLCISNIAVTTDERDTKLPTDRSIPPVKMTRVIPIAGRANIDTLLRTFS